MRSLLSIALVGMVGSLLPATASAQVGPAAGGGCIHPDITTAMAAGLTAMYVAPGTYVEPASLAILANTQIIASNATCTAAAPAGTRPVTVQMPAAGGRVFDVQGGNLTLRNLVVEGGNVAGSGGNVRVTNDASLTLVDSEVRSGTANDGGGIAVEGCGVVTVDPRSTVHHNTAVANGGGIYASTAATCSRRPFVRVYGGVSDNAATNGGGIHLTQADALLGDAAVTFNQATGNGGGIHATNFSAIQANGTLWAGAPEGAVPTGGVEILSNDAGADGGGVALVANSTLTGTHVIIASNEATTGGGGGLFADGSHTDLESSIIQANKAGNDGGGVAAIGDGSFRLRHTSASACNAAALPGNRYCAEIRDNEAVSFGGGIFTEQPFSLAETAVIRNVGGGVGTAIHVGNWNPAMLYTSLLSTVLVEENPLAVNPPATVALTDPNHITLWEFSTFGTTSWVEHSASVPAYYNYNVFQGGSGRSVSLLLPAGGATGDCNVDPYGVIVPFTPGSNLPNPNLGTVAGVRHVPVAPSDAIDICAPPPNAPATDILGFVRPAGANIDAGVFEQ